MWLALDAAAVVLQLNIAWWMDGTQYLLRFENLPAGRAVH